MNGLLEKARLQFAHDATVLAGIENGSVRVIPLTHGLVTVVDKEIYEFVVQRVWHASKGAHTWYARSGRKSFMFHRIVLNLNHGDKRIVDLDNRRLNLRIVNRSINAHNRGLDINNTSGYRGVHWNKLMNAWQARVFRDGCYYNCGFYNDKVLAAKARDKKEADMWGAEAILNFPLDNLSDMAQLQGMWDEETQSFRGK